MEIKLLEIPYDGLGIIQSRPNRFMGIVDLIDLNTDQVIENAVKAHVHDPGRLKEILYPGNRVLLKKPDPNRSSSRKTRWDIIAGRVNEQWVLINSSYHRSMMEAIFNNEKLTPFGRLKDIRPEVKFGKSRLDFLLTDSNGREIYVEVKGCTLTEDGIALFPDAPTDRGRRHLEELTSAIQQGYDAAVVVLVFREDSSCFLPNAETDPKFAATFEKAMGSGVKIFPIVLNYRSGIVSYIKKIPICQAKL